MARLVSLVVLVAIILVIGVLFFRVMATFAVPLFLAAVLVVIFGPVHTALTKRLGGRHRIAAVLTTIIIALSVLIPVACVVTLAAMEGVTLASEMEDVEFRDRFFRLRRSLGLEPPYTQELDGMQAAFDKLADPQQGEAPMETDVVVENILDRLSDLERRMLDRMTDAEEEAIDELRSALDELRPEAIQPGTLAYENALAAAINEFEDLRIILAGGRLQAYMIDLTNLSEEELGDLTRRSFSGVTGWLLPVAGATTAIILKVLIGVIILLVAVYYFLADGPAMVRTTMRLVPLDDRYERELLAEFAQISRAVVLATMLSAVVQGLLAGIGYAAAGLHSVFLLILLTSVLAMIPFLGAAAVWLPASLWLYFSEERLWAAVLLALYGAGVVSLVDNIIKPVVLHGQSRLHPLLALLSILGGVQVLGPIGLIIGPMSVAFLQTLLNILHREITSLERAQA